MTATDVRPPGIRRDDEIEVVLHDFRRPEGLTRAQRELVDAAFVRFSALADDVLTNLMRAPTTLALEEVAESSWGDLVASRDDHPISVPFSLKPLDGTCVLVLPTATGRVIADLRLGGTGADDSTDPLGTVERGLACQVAYGVLHHLHGAFADLLPMTVQPVDTEGEDGTEELLDPEELCLVAHFTLTLDGRPPCRVDVCLPSPTTRGMVEALRARLAQMEAGRTRPPTSQATERLAHVPLEVTLQFPAIATTAESVLQLAVGDELALGVATSEPLEVRAEGLLVARATIGRSGDRKACSIVEEVLP